MTQDSSTTVHERITWQNVYDDGRIGVPYDSKDTCDVAAGAGRIAIRRIVTVETITRWMVPRRVGVGA